MKGKAKPSPTEVAIATLEKPRAKVHETEVMPMSESDSAAQKWPRAVTLLDAINRQASQLTDSYRHTVVELREMNIPSGELTMLLLHVGMKKAMASKLKRIVGAPTDLFERYTEGLGFNATLQIIRSRSGSSSLSAEVVTLLTAYLNDLIAEVPTWREGRAMIKHPDWEMEVKVKRVATSPKVVNGNEADISAATLARQITPADDGRVLGTYPS